MSRSYLFFLTYSYWLGKLQANFNEMRHKLYRWIWRIKIGYWSKRYQIGGRPDVSSRQPWRNERKLSRRWWGRTREREASSYLPLSKPEARKVAQRHGRRITAEFRLSPQNRAGRKQRLCLRLFLKIVAASVAKRVPVALSSSYSSYSCYYYYHYYYHYYYVFPLCRELKYASSLHRDTLLFVHWIIDNRNGLLPLIHAPGLYALYRVQWILSLIRSTCPRKKVGCQNEK